MNKDEWNSLLDKKPSLRLTIPSERKTEIEQMAKNEGLSITSYVKMYWIELLNHRIVEVNEQGFVFDGIVPASCIEDLKEIPDGSV